MCSNPFGNRTFNAYSAHMKNVFGQRIQKLSIDAGFTCPNRDGRLSFGGCIFCSNDAFNPSYCHGYKNLSSEAQFGMRQVPDITVQIEEGIKFHAWRYKHVQHYLAYFQPYSNTYAPLNVLKQMYEQALSHPQIIGLVIGTRPDCVNNEVLDYLAELNEEYHIVVEYGIESCYDKTLAFVNRGHTFDCTVKALQETHKRGIETGGHIIFGFPTENEREMLAQADILSLLPIDNLKFHQLQILNNTPMQQDYLANKERYKFFSFDEYVDFIIRFLERLNPAIIIERFASEVPPRYNAGPTWGKIRNEQIVQTIEQEMQKRNTWQGKFFSQQ